LLVRLSLLLALSVDRSRTPAHGMIVLDIVDGEFTVQYLHRRGTRVALLPQNPHGQPIDLHDS